MIEDPVEDKSGSKAEPKLTLKQAKFVEAYAATGNGTKSARLAGYRGDANQLGVQGWLNLRNAKIQRALCDRLHNMTDHVMKTLEEGMDATKSKSLLDKAGNVVTTDPEPDHKSRLQAVQIWHKMVSKCSVDFTEEVGEDAAVQEQELSAADRVLIRHAAEAEAELAEIERELHDHDSNGGHSDQAAGALNNARNS